MSSNAKIFDIGGERYASGLFWQVLKPTKSGQVPHAEIKKISKSLDFRSDHYAILKAAENIQVGYCLAPEGKDAFSNVKSFAMAMREAVASDNWAGAFFIDNAWVYVGVKNGFILPDGDAVFDSVDDLRNRLEMEAVTMGQWDLIYSNDPNVRIDKVTIVDLADTLLGAGRMKEARIVPISIKVPWGKMVAAFVMVSLAAGGFFGWKEYQRREAEKRAAIAAAQAAAAAEAAKKAAMVTPWNDLPSAVTFASRCFDAASQKRIIDSGWRLSAVECDGQEMILSYQNLAGTPDALISSNPAAEIPESGKSATVKSGLIISVPQGSGQVKVTDLSGRNAFLTKMQRIGITAPLVVDKDGGVNYNKYSWTIQTDFAPVGIAVYFSELNGVVIKKMRLDANSFVWTINGEFYEKK